MIRSFLPHLEIFPDAQLRLWPQLHPIADLGFALYGGTAIALRLGHRSSVDFDFFTERLLHRASLEDALPFLRRAQVLQESPDTLTVLASAHSADQPSVKFSFFGSISFGRVGEPQRTDDGIVQVASLEDLLATKVKVLLQRIEAKDYLDVAALLGSGVELATGLAAARSLFGPAFQPSESLKALVYFEGGDLKSLPETTRHLLIHAATAVGDLPSVPIVNQQLTVG